MAAGGDGGGRSLRATIEGVGAPVFAPLVPNTMMERMAEAQFAILFEDRFATACRALGSPCLALPAPGPAPRSAPVTGSLAGSDTVRSIICVSSAWSLRPSLTLAEPSRPSTAAYRSRSSTNSHCPPWFQGPRMSPSPWDMFY